MTTPPRDRLPLECAPVFTEGAWSVRLPVRAERVTLSRQPHVRERVVITRRRIEGTARAEAVLRREELRTETSGRMEVTEKLTDKIPQR
ncbi:MAG: DUF2382 domain-containing protein [Chloroflexi bacterium]|nr:DUF2382 domain-containing protein [Chloroflexota bacterium]MBV9599080.1 DUF2382 domain-containing protein [Chloroflexota bacterium]